MKATIIKILSVLLLLCIFPAALFSCTSANDPPDTPTSGSEQQTEDESESETNPAGTLTVFKNGNYAAKLIYAEKADEACKTAVNRIKAALNTKTGKGISENTDFVSADGALDASPAILVGETAYEESKSVYAALKDGEAVAKIVNNKYVVAFSNADVLNTLIQKIEEKITNASAEEIVIDSNWNITLLSTATVPTGVLPDFDGKPLGTAIDIGQGSKLYILKDATQAKYTAYAIELEKAGFKLYASSIIASNLFATYTTDKQIINIMFLKNSAEVRITVDNKDSIDLPPLKSTNDYTKTSTPSFTMMGISDSGYPGGMSFIYKLSDGTFFIIDGGICADRVGSDECSGDPSVNRLFKTLQALADDPNKIVISGWLITHIHNDHAGAFIDLAEKSDYLSKITIKQVIYSQPSNSDMQDGNQPKRLNWMPDALKKMGITKTVKAHPGQVFYYADLKLTILGTHDLIKPAKIERHNNASIVSMVEFGNKKALYLADAEGQHNEQLKKLYGSYLTADILQVAHHGYNNTNAGIIYEYVNPTIVLWPIQASDYNKGTGANVYNVDFNKKYLDKSGIAHYCAGEANITFENFTSWTPSRQNWKP